MGSLDRFMRHREPEIPAGIAGVAGVRGPGASRAAANDYLDDTYRRWLIHHPDGWSSHAFTPPASRAEVERGYPGCEVQPEADVPTVEPLPLEARQVIEAWLDVIGEDDIAVRADFLAGLAQAPAQLRPCFEAAVKLGIAAWDQPTRAVEDIAERVACASCAHWTPDPINPAGGLGRCRVEAPASRHPGALWPRGEVRCARWEGAP